MRYIVQSGIVGIVALTQVGLFCIPAIYADSPSYRGIGNSIISGDTLIIERNDLPQNVRLHGVLCPKPDDPFCEQAKEFTKAKVLGKFVRVEEVTTDADGTSVGTVCPLRFGLWVSAASDCLEEQLVKAGLARWNRKDDPYNSGLEKLEREARDAMRGIWKQPETAGTTHGTITEQNVRKIKPDDKKGTEVQFSSVYTDLDRDCENIHAKRGQGNILPFTCKGYGRYSLKVSYRSDGAGNRIAQLSVLDGPSIDKVFCDLGKQTWSI